MRRLPSLLAACAVLGAACTSAAPAAEDAPTAEAVSPAAPRPAAAPSASGERTAETRPRPPATVEPFRDPAGLVASLRTAELAIRDPATPREDLGRWAWVQQQAYRDLAVNPGWRAEARRALPADLQPAFDANLRAGIELRALTEPRDALPPWRIVAPPPPEELRAHYAAAERASGVPWTYLAAIHLVETRMGRIRGASVAGARGPMQFLPSTWEAYGEGDIEDPGDAIAAAARYLVDHGAPADLDGALWAYNHSDHYVRAVSAYADVMADDERAWLGYYHWRVYYRLRTGDVVLDVGYGD